MPLSGGGGDGGFTSDFSDYDILRVNLCGDSSFAAKINGAPSGTSVVYDTVTGNENAINVADSNQIGKLRLYNSTRTNYALISSVDTGTNTITVTDADDISDWEDNDNIQANSPTCVDPGGPPYYFEIDLSNAIPSGSTLIGLHVASYDSTTPGLWTKLHPYSAYAVPSIFGWTTNVAAKWFCMATVLFPVVSNKICINWDASGAATYYIIVRLMGYQ